MAIDEKKLIYADKLIEELIPILQCLDNPFIVGRVIGCIYSQPKISLETKTSDKWIPCSERLPNDTAIHEVTEQFNNGKIYTEFAYYDESRGEWWKFDDDGIVNVIAWKEHSEPYQGE